MEQPQPITLADLMRELGTARSVTRLVNRARSHVLTEKAQGEPVMTLPGFGFGDGVMALMRRRLARAGFTPYRWKLGINTGAVLKLLPLATERVEQVAEEEGQQVRLVGWSLGGYLAREIARDRPDLVAHVVTLGSPIVGGPKYTATAGLYRRLGIDVDDIEQKVAERDSVPLIVPVSCFYSLSDGVVDWRAARDQHNRLTDNIEVECSHMAMGFDPIVGTAAVHALLEKLNARA